MDILNVSSLTKAFGSQTVIDDLSFSVQEHSIFGFLGQNGAGKTTTMKMILGLLKPDQGNITVCGEKVTYGQTKTNRHIGYLCDVPEFYGYMKPMEYLKLCGDITGMSASRIKSRGEELLGLVGLSGANKRIGGFSRGMKQRLGIAQALLNEPKLLICDEPTSALDPIGRKEILDILGKVRGETTVIFSTHILSDVERICDSIAVLHKGKILLTGEMEAIKAEHKSDSILVELETPDDLQRFKAAPELSEYQEREYSENTIIIHTANLKRAEADILSILYHQQILPTRLAILEPTLETLFMEVVQ